MIVADQQGLFGQGTIGQLPCGLHRFIRAIALARHALLNAAKLI
ncbi:hypothetical protein [Chitinophaga sp.]|nr:hypothetical protein [Chitinophaga sp.]